MHCCRYEIEGALLVRVLAVTFEAPSKMYGGGIGIIQSLESLCGCATVDYVGPEFDAVEFPGINVSRAWFLNETKNVLLKAVNVLNGTTARYYQDWVAISEKLDASCYDVVFVDFSYNDFIVEWAKRNNLPVVLRVHNIEQDMSRLAADGSVHDKYWLRSKLNGRRIALREQRGMEGADVLLFLTKQDCSRAASLYGEGLKGKSMILPVCVSDKKRDAAFSVSDDPYILATGSLYFGPNAQGIKWLIRNVWDPLSKDGSIGDLKLLIAGRRPDRELVALVEASSHCELVDTPDEMAPYFSQALFYLAPIFSGAGMKVKVGEALSYGLYVVGSMHALIGYEGAAPYVVQADSAQEFRDAIRKLAMNRETMDMAACKNMFLENYSMDNSRMIVSQALDRAFSG